MESPKKLKPTSQGVMPITDPVKYDLKGTFIAEPAKFWAAKGIAKSLMRMTANIPLL